MKQYNNEPMKIAFVSDAVYPYNKGGKEKRIYEISTRLARLGHDVHIYCMKWWSIKHPWGDRNGLPWGEGNHRLENGVYLHAISPYYPLYSGERRSIRQGIMFGLHCLKLIREDWDVIDVDHMPFFPLFSVKLVCLLKGKKMFATWNEVWGRKYWQEYLPGWKGYIAYLIERLSVCLPDKIISISEHTKKRLQSEFGYRKHIDVVEMGVDLELIRRVKPSKEKSDVIFVGRLLKHKNVDILIRAIDLLVHGTHNTKYVIRNTKCIIIGEGPEESNLKRLVKELRLEKNVIFKGRVEKDTDVYALMKSSKVFVLPSTREGFGIVVLEANACGIPVISTNHKDNHSKILIKGNNGILSELSEIELSKTIKKILNLKTGKFSFTQALNNHNWDNIIRKIERIYQ